MWPNGTSTNDTSYYGSTSGNISWTMTTKMRYENGEWVVIQNNIKKPIPREGKQYLFDFMEEKVSWAYA